MDDANCIPLSYRGYIATVLFILRLSSTPCNISDLIALFHDQAACCHVFPLSSDFMRRITQFQRLADANRLHPAWPVPKPKTLPGRIPSRLQKVVYYAPNAT